MNISQEGDFKTTEGQVIGVAPTSIPDYEGVRKRKNIETSRTAEDRQLILAGVMNPEEKSYCLRAERGRGTRDGGILVVMLSSINDIYRPRKGILQFQRPG
ncbi:hypothetical protein NGA_0170100 [Nannochloropsis gaditana CCMP526]|uniref:uncharacterized protein n=1 Tax=Nannochloropsis gaditana (strain CCMP526) TaxID=1093141 RepID=UPI00029F4F86|nr:hypothetical protein NGA_0170100 [Nannochloropsis gaditana CCMP526]EKU21723.1 hypothetical protein NGA_0170100 [Nannochloropsis gaditana CCMP526]|eukprot:XP_005854636.1 hypothetical protein NGA_0170100 [Nannochloropsis gaditana CCMP526]